MPMTAEDQDIKISPVFKGFGAVLGIILAVIIFQTMTIWKIQQFWPATTGVVVKTSSKGWWNEHKQHRYYLEYQYTIGEKKFTNVQFHIKEGSIKKYKYLIQDFRKQDPIQVWVNPENPDQAVINTDYLRNGFALMIVITGFLVMAGTMIVKEKIWQQQTRNLKMALPMDYKGTQPLPSSGILSDKKGILTLNTGMSVFWSFGIPFLFFSFVSLFLMIRFLNEINPGWALSDYAGVMVLSFGACMIGGGFVNKGFKNTLEINADKKKIKQTSVVLFKPKTIVYDFSDVHELKLHQDTWRASNTLKNWILYIPIRSRQSLFVSFRHRDIQPANENYLNTVKQRIEYLIFGEKK